MSAVKLIARREWLAITCSPAGLVVLGGYLLLAGYIFSLNLSVTQEASLRYTFSSLGVMTVFVAPLITMRLLAEELRSGTFEILTAHPVTDRQIVLGKFLAGCVTFVILSAPTLSYLLILQAYGSPDWGPALSGYLGQQLLAAMLVALGLFVSALTSSQVLAAMGAMVGGILLWLAGTAAYSVQGRLGDALAYLAMFEHFSPFRRGVIDTRSLIYFVATTAMFVYLAVRAVESRRWKFGALPGATTGKGSPPRLTIGLTALAIILLGEAFISRAIKGIWTAYNSSLVSLGILLALALLWSNRARLREEMAQRQTGVGFTVLMNCLLVLAIWSLATFMTSRHYLRLDLTTAKRYALSEQTKKILAQLAAPLEVAVVSTAPADLRQEISDLLAEYKARSSRLAVQTVDPLRNPGELERLRQRYKLTSNPADEILVASGEHVRRLPIASLIRQTFRVAGDQLVPGPVQFVGEAEITSAIIQLTRKAPGQIVFLAGHAEKNPDDTNKSGASFVASELRRLGWAVEKHIVAPGAQAEFPTNTTVAVIAGPATKLSDEDLKAMHAVLDRGGGILVMLEPGADAGLEIFLNPWNVRMGDNLVVDLEDHLAAADPTSLYVTRFNRDHPIGKGMGELAAVLPTARRVAVAYAQANPHISTHNFMHTSGNGWAVTYQPGKKFELDKQRDRPGPISLGMACERFQEFPEPGRPPLHGRIVVIGDSDFISNQYVDMAGNLNLFLNCIDWLAGRQDLIAVRPKVVDIRRMSLTAGQTKVVFWLSVLCVPAAALTVGITAIRRRKRSA